MTEGPRPRLIAVDLVGPGQAKRMLFSGELLSAEEALRIGLVDLIDDSPDTLVDAVAANSLHSTCAAKVVIRRILDGQAGDDEDSLALFADAFEGDDFKEGVAAFLEKRPPAFSKGGE